MTLIIVLAVIVLLAVWLISGYNGFVKKRNRVEEGFATMDVYLKKRFDIIPNLVSTVKGYAKHEKETLAEVVKARNNAISAKDLDERVTQENAISGALGKLFALAENYPNLKADSQFLDLQRQLENVENDIAQSRKYYNAVVKEFNTKCEMFPASIIAKMFSFKRFNMFEVSDETERENVKVSFDE
jgi:LemA protein